MLEIDEKTTKNYTYDDWRPIKGFPEYFVSKNGQVMGKKKVLKQTPDQYGYCSVSLYNNGLMKRKRVHRLVAEAFIPNTYEKTQINHKDGIKTNNSANNLEWVTPSENQFHRCHELGKMPTNLALARARHIEKSSKPVICVENGVRYKSIAEAARDNGIWGQNIHKVCHGKLRTAGGYHWRFI